METEIDIRPKHMRKIFNYENPSEFAICEKPSQSPFKKSVSAGGIVIYKIINNDIFMLLIKYSDPKFPKLDDFGGQIDIEDEKIESAIIRETYEESNGLIKLEDKIFENSDKYYTQDAKYLFYLHKVDSDFMNDTTIFGNREEHDDFNRTINWYRYNGNLRRRLSIRLKTNITFINNMHLICKSIKNKEIIHPSILPVPPTSSKHKHSKSKSSKHKSQWKPIILKSQIPT